VVGAAEGASAGGGDRLALIRRAAVAALGLALATGCASDSEADIDKLRASSEPRYWLGEEFEGLPLTHADDRLIVYGDCDPGPDAGCSPPLELQHWALGERHPSQFTEAPGRLADCRRGTLEGTLVAAFSTTGGLEVYLGRTVLVVFAESQRAMRAVKSLRRLNGPQRLPEPPSNVRRSLARCSPGLGEAL
jgi:hypothetical protein